MSASRQHTKISAALMKRLYKLYQSDKVGWKSGNNELNVFECMLAIYNITKSFILALYSVYYNDCRGIYRVMMSETHT